MKKRYLAIFLLFSLLLPTLTSCLRIKEKKVLPADFVDGNEIVIDNETPFVYGEAANPDHILENAFAIAQQEGYTYSYFADWCGNKIIRHFKSGDVERYYTVYSCEDNTLFYLFLKPDGNGNFLMESCSRMDIRYEGWLPDSFLFEYDYPSAIIGDHLPSHCLKENQSFDEIEWQVSCTWKSYEENCYEADLENYVSIQHEKDDNGKYKNQAFYRIIQSVAFDVIYDVHYAYSGLYVYDIYFYADGSGTLHYRHYIFESFPKYTMDQEETVILTVDEVTALKNIINDNNFYEIPTWNPEEFVGSDGEYTYILGFDENHSEHLISMWESTPRYGIYHIRTAVENLVREKIEVTSGSVYIDYVH